MYLTISEEYPKEEEEMEKRWTMDQKMKNFCEGQLAQKKSKFGRQRTTTRKLCTHSSYYSSKTRRLLSATKRRTTRALLPNEDSAWWYVRFEIRWANANRKPHRRKRSNRNWTRNSRVRFAITTNRSPRNWTFNNTKG